MAMHPRPPSPRVRGTLLAVACTLLLAAPGCLDLFGADKSPPPYSDRGWEGADATGEDEAAWPDPKGGPLIVLDVGSWQDFDAAARQFEALTGIEVQRKTAAGPLAGMEMVEKAASAERPAVLMGLDQMSLLLAVERGVVETYQPLLGDRVAPGLQFWEDAAWPGVPYEHVYYALHWAPGHPETETEEGPFVRDIFTARERADLLMVPDPRHGTPAGLSFLWMTIARFGDDPSFYDWQEFWRDITVSPDVDGQPGRDRGRVLLGDPAAAYDNATRAAEGNQSAKPLVWLRTTLAPRDTHAAQGNSTGLSVLVEDRATWHRIATASVVNGTRDRAAAQAWLEFLLTDYVQQRLPEYAASYPVLASAVGQEAPAFGGMDVRPGSFRPAWIDPEVAAAKTDDWLAEFQAACQLYAC